MRAVLESLLRARKLDVTLAPFGPAGEPLAPVPDHARVAPISATSDLAPLDAALGGGLRRGHLSDVAGAASTGRTTIVVRALAAATARGEAVALVDTCDTFDPASAAAQGVALPQLLWVRGTGDAAQGLKAFSLILQAGGFGLAVFDLADVAPAALRRLPATTWMRLARIVEGRDTAALLVGAERIARSAGGVTIACETAAAGWQGAGHRARVFAGIDSVPRVVGGRR
jgi:recA bacterial DNA recombination protein